MAAISPCSRHQRQVSSTDPLSAPHRLLTLLGFSDVNRDGETITSATPEQTPGYILTRFADKYGRPVSFAFAGTSDQAGLSSVYITTEMLRQSVNYQVLTEYETRFNAHRPHRALNQTSPLRALPDPIDADIKVTRRDRIGGLLHEYAQVALGVAELRAPTRCG